MKNVIVVSQLNGSILPKGELWLVIGPYCYGKSRSLPVALDNAVRHLSVGGGSFTARIVPDGDLTIENDGGYSIAGWTLDQKERAASSTRIVAVTKTAVKKWGAEAKMSVIIHRKEIANDLPVS